VLDVPASCASRVGAAAQDSSNCRVVAVQAYDA
jgi:hypothetical protein